MRTLFPFALPGGKTSQQCCATGLVSAVLTLFVSAASGHAAVDLNANGYGDVWEELYDAGSLDPAANEDGDFQTNAEEDQAGTDPRDARSHLAIAETRISGTDIVVKWGAQVGKAYRILSTADVSTGSWVPVTQFRTATAVAMEETVAGAASTGTSLFFRVEVADADTDADGLSDWDERNLPGFDPNSDQSAIPGQGDLVTLTAQLVGGGNRVSVTAPVPVAVEKEAVNGVLRITRTGGLRATTVNFALTGNPVAAKGSASPSDYTLRDGAGTALTTTVRIPFGVAGVDVSVRPVADTLVETPEMLTLTLTPGPSYTVGTAASAAVTVTDAANTPANERLFVAYLVPVEGTGSPASGLATVRVQGDNAAGLVSLGFNGLTSPETTAILELNNGGAGSYIKGLPAGQVTNNSWPIKAAAFLLTDQLMLDELFSGHVFATVNTTNFGTGEIRGNFVLGGGSVEPPLPPEPPEITPLTGDALRRDAARFLTQTTFGPTEATITALVSDVETKNGGDRIAAYRAWIQAQFALDPTSLEAYTRAADGQEWARRGTDPVNYVSAVTGEPGTSNRRRAWWMAAVGANDQLRQRVAFALSEIFVISEKNTEVSSRHYGAAHYYDQLALAPNGTFRALLEDVSKSPMMGTYLSHLKNQKAILNGTGGVVVSPDENYAREIMQLFSIGLVQLHPDGSLKLGADGLPIPTYTNADITELARVFTGWSFSKRHGSKAGGYVMEDNPSFTQSSGPTYFQASWIYPMKNFATYHDTASKRVLGQLIPAGLDGEADLDAALDVLANHPNVAPFISKLLIQRLVTSTPSAGYIYRVAQKFLNNGTGVRGHLGAVVEAILLDPEARNPDVAEYVGFGKQKEPIVRYVQLLRAFSAYSQLQLSDLSSHGYPAEQLNNFPAGSTRMRFNNTDSSLAQTPQSSPTVFNWFLPGYSPGGAITGAGLVAPEMQITNETQVFQAINFNRTLLNITGTGTGQGGTAVFGDTDGTLDDIRVSRASWEAAYAAEITAGKTPTQAVTTLVDRLDLLLMSGHLKIKYASAPTPNPRSSIIESAVRYTSTSTTDRVINIFYLMSNCPEFLHQK